MSFAKKTVVSSTKTQDEIRRTLEKYKASGFMFGEANGQAVCAFEMNARRIKFVIELPTPGVTPSPKNKYKKLTQNECEQKTRTAWRCLLLAIKAKLECAASGISTFEQEFMAHIVMPNGQTIGAMIVPQIDGAYKTGKMPPLLGAGGIA